MNKPFEQLTVEELKSLAYDQLIELNRVQKNIQILEARIAEVSKLPVEKDVKDKSTKNK